MTMFVLHGNPALLLLSILFLVWGSSFGLYLVLPPAVLFLAASREQQFELQAKLGVLCYPLFVISFLDTDLIFNEQDAPKSAVHAAMQHSSFRTFDDSDWEATVRRWLDIVPLIVVDCRAPSPAVAQEVEWIVDSRLTHKTAFLGTSSATGDMNVLTENELPELLARTLRIPIRAPW